MQILISIIVALIVICITIYLNKRTAAKLYSELVQECDKPKSPYGISRELASNGFWGYCITKDGEVMYSDKSSQVFSSFEVALKEINKLEAVQGYKKTRV